MATHAQTQATTATPSETDAAFIFKWLFVGVVSIYDAWLVVRFAELMPAHEQNPIGRLLMELDGGGVDLFVACKMVGTAITLLVVRELWLRNRRIATPVINTLAAGQAILLCYLTLF